MQELVVVPTVLQVQVRPLIRHQGYRHQRDPQILAHKVRHHHHDAEHIKPLEGGQIDHQPVASTGILVDFHHRPLE